MTAGPQQYEVWQVKALAVAECEDARPCIVIEVLSSGDVQVAPLSAQFDLYRGPSVHFRIDESHKCFTATGLKKSCYVLGDCLGTVSQDQLLKKRGVLQGALLDGFVKWL